MADENLIVFHSNGTRNAHMFLVSAATQHSLWADELHPAPWCINNEIYSSALGKFANML